MGLTTYLSGTLEPKAFTFKWLLFEILGSKLAVKNFSVRHGKGCVLQCDVFSTFGSMHASKAWVPDLNCLQYTNETQMVN